MKPKIFIVLLRRPTNEPNEMRSDPFWEFGSFGLTGCHSRNLLNPNKIERLKNSRLAFVQGGNDGFKLLLVTPEIKINVVRNLIEVNWKPVKLPFKYQTAPTIIRNDKETVFPYLTKYFMNNRGLTSVVNFSSSFRAKTTPLEEDVAEIFIKDFEKFYKRAKVNDLISDYSEALSYSPPTLDKKRATTYKLLKSQNKQKCH